MDNKYSFDSEGCSDCEEGEINESSKKTNDTKEKNSSEISNYKLIKAISQTLSTILENNKKTENYKSIVKNQNKMPFSANLIPSITIQDYLIRIQTYANMEKSTLIIGLIFIDRLCHKANITLTYYNIHRILFTAFLISIKYNEDSYYDNKYYSEIAGVKTKELKLLEYTFISMINFRLFVDYDIYDKYENYLDNFEQQ